MKFAVERIEEELINIIETTNYDFEKSRKCFEKFLEYFGELYENEMKQYLANEDLTSFTTRTLHEKLGRGDFYKNQPKANPSSSPKSQEKVVDWAAKFYSPDEPKPSSFNIFKNSLKDEFDQLYNETKAKLPSFEDLDETEDKDLENDEEAQKLFSSGLPPPTDFEKSFFVTDEKWTEMQRDVLMKEKSSKFKEDDDNIDISGEAKNQSEDERITVEEKLNFDQEREKKIEQDFLQRKQRMQQENQQKSPQKETPSFGGSREQRMKYFVDYSESESEDEEGDTEMKGKAQ